MFPCLCLKSKQLGQLAAGGRLRDARFPPFAKFEPRLERVVYYEVLDLDDEKDEMKLKDWRTPHVWLG